MFLTNIKRVIKAGLINFWRNGSVSLASVVVITITLFVIGSILASRAFLVSSLDDLKSKVDISVSFLPQVEESVVTQFKNEVALLPEVKEVTMSTREEELTDFKERNKDNTLILQSLEEVGNPFGARINIVANDPSQYESIVKFLNTKDDGVLAGTSKNLIDDVSFKKDSAEKLIKIINMSERMGIAVSLVLVFMSVIVTFNTIALAIYVSREEIGVMRLVGADDTYIRGPFVIEGALSGLIGALVAIGLLYPATLWVRNVTAGVYGGLDLLAYYLVNFVPLFFTLVIIGIFLGVAASFMAVRHHLKI